MSLTASHCYWLSLTVSMEFLHVSHSLLWLLNVSCCPSGPMELLHVSHCCCMSLTVSPSAIELLYVSHCHFQLYGVAACLSLSPMFAGCLSLSLPLLWICCMFLTVSSSSIELLHAPHCLLWFLAVSHCLSSPMVLLHVSHFCWLSLIVSPSAME